MIDDATEGEAEITPRYAGKSSRATRSNTGASRQYPT
jgi:hypothetical protein